MLNGTPEGRVKETREEAILEDTMATEFTKLIFKVNENIKPHIQEARGLHEGETHKQP